MIIFRFLNILYHVTLYICGKISQKRKLFMKQPNIKWSPCGVHQNPDGALILV